MSYLFRAKSHATDLSRDSGPADAIVGRLVRTAPGAEPLSCGLESADVRSTYSQVLWTLENGVSCATAVSRLITV